MQKCALKTDQVPKYQILHTHKYGTQSNQKILNTETQLNFEKELTSVTVKITVHTTNTPDHLSKITVALKKDTSNQNQTGQGSYFCHHTPRVYDVRHIGSKSILEEYFYLLLSMFSRNKYLTLIQKLKNWLHTYMKQNWVRHGCTLHKKGRNFKIPK